MNLTLSLRKIYLLVQQTADNLTPAIDGSNVSQWGLYSSTQAAWRFPDNDNLPPGNATLITSSQVNQVWMGSITTSTLQLALQPTPASAYAAWAAVVFAGHPNADASAQADPDGDGISNALECLFGTLPLTSNGPVYRLERVGAGVTFRYPRNAALPAGYERLEISSTLSGWAPPTFAQFAKSIIANEWLYNFPQANNDPRLFFRIACRGPECRRKSNTKAGVVNAPIANDDAHAIARTEFHRHSAKRWMARARR